MPFPLLSTNDKERHAIFFDGLDRYIVVAGAHHRHPFLGLADHCLAVLGAVRTMDPDSQANGLAVDWVKDVDLDSRFDRLQRGEIHCVDPISCELVKD